MMKNKTNVKWKKRAATIVMSLCLLMGLMPIAVFAAGSSAQLPVYTIESEADGDYVKRDVTATLTSSTEFTLGAFHDDYNVYGVKLDYYNAKKYDTVSYHEVLNKDLAVMDSTAASLCKDNNIPILVFSIEDPENIYKAVCGENIGTVVNSED